MQQILSSYDGEDIEGYAKMIFGAMLEMASVQMMLGDIVTEVSGSSFKMTANTAQGIRNVTTNLVTKN